MTAKIQISAKLLNLKVPHVHASPTQTVFSGEICTVGWAASSTILHILLTDNYIHSRFQQNTLQRCNHVPTGL